MVNKSIFKNKLNIKILAALMLMVSVFIPNTALANTAVDNLMEQANNANEMLMMANDLDAGDIVPTIPAEIALDITNTSWNVSKTAEDNVMIYLVADDENVNKYKLVVEGTGEMMDLTEYLYAAADQKWYAYAQYIYEIEIKEGVTSVGDMVFSGLWNLEKLSLPSTLESIGYYSFSNCADLKETIELSKNFTHTSEGAFYQTPIEAIHVEDGSINFSSYDGVLYNKQSGGGLEIYPMGKTGSSYTVLEGITYISPMAFSYSSVSNVILPESLQTLHYAAFKNSNITSIVIPENVRVIEWAVFSDSKLLETVYLNSSKIVYMDAEIFSNMKPGSAVYTKNKAMADKFIADVHYTSAYTQVCYPPEIAFDLRNAASGIGKNATFTIEVIPGNPNDTTYNWQYRTSSSDTWKDVTDAQGTGIGTPSFTTITVTEEMLQYEYRCVIGCGNYPNQEMTFDELEERFVSNAARILEAEKLMITEWTIPEGGATIKLPVTGEVDIVVDWADGNVETIKGTFTKDNLPEHTFTRGGKKEIWVSGKVGVWGFSSSEDTGTQYLTGLKQWGELGVSAYKFAYCENLEYVSGDVTDHTFDNLTLMNDMFRNCKSLLTLDLSYINTSKVTNMYNMFGGCTALTSVNLSGWDTSKVTNMAYMFNECYALKSLDLTHFNTSSVETIWGMFFDCRALNSLNLNNFDTSNAQDFGAMFLGCRSLETLDLSNFDTVQIVRTMQMFAGCYSLKTLNLSSFDMSKVYDSSRMFVDCTSLASIQISNKFVVPSTNEAMFSNTPNLTSIIITSTTPSGDQFGNATAVIPAQLNFYVPNASEAAYEEAFASYNEDKVRPILGTTKAPALIAIGGTYVDDTYITIADFDNSQKEYYEPYGYTLTKAGEVKTDTLGTYTRTYTLNRTYSGDTENITEKVAETTRDVVVGSANYSVNGNFYTSLAHAYMAIEGAEGTIVVEASNTDDSEFIVEPGKTVILDTNGKTITKTEVGIVNNGTLTIEGNGTIETLDVDNNKISVLIYNNNSLEINEVNIIHKGYDLTNSWNYIIYSYGNLTINGGNLKVTGNVGEYNRGIVVTSLGKLNMMSGSIINEGSGIAIVSDTYQGTEINIYDGTIRGGYYTIYLENSANYTVNNTTLNIYGGTIESRLSGYAIANYYGKKVNIYGGNIKSNIGGAIYSRITDSITIGTSGDSVSTTSPVIQGATYGINSTNDIKFYDGIIKGKDGAINGNAITEANYVVIKESELIDGVSYETAFPAIGWDVSKTPGTDNVWAYLVEEAENAGKYKLVVSGTGAMVDLEEILFVETDKKWYAYAEDIYEVEIKEGVTNLGDRTFNGFWNIEKITFPSTLERIGNFALAYCDSLKGTIEIPKNTIDILAGAFVQTPIEAINVEEGNIHFSSYEGVLYNKQAGGGVAVYPMGKTGSSYTVLDGIKYISPYAFAYTNVSNVILPESLEVIYSGAFLNGKITSITIPENVRNLLYGVFLNSSELETVYLNSKEIDFMDTEVFNNIKPGSIIYTTSKSIADKFVAGTHYTSANTTIYYPPEITTQPTNQKVVVGNKGTFTIAVTAGVPNDITYTWQYRTSSEGEWQNATEAQGTGYNTATFTTITVTEAMLNYEYRCIIGSSSYPNAEMTQEELAERLVSDTVKIVDTSKSMITEWTIPDGGATIKLPVTGAVDIVVDWGDGSEVQEIKGTFTSGDMPEHKYTTGGKKDIWVTGTVGAYGLNNIFKDEAGNDIEDMPEDKPYYTHAKYLTGLKQWGELGVLSYGFSYCENLVYVSGDATENTFDNVNSMLYMFYKCTSLESIDLSKFDTSNVTYMSGMFRECKKITSVDLSSFNTSKVINMDAMFFNCSELTNITFGENFDTSSVRIMYYMFRCPKLLQLDVSGFDTSNVTDMTAMFSGCNLLTSLDVSGFDTSNVTNMYAMFLNCSGLTSLDVSKFNTSKVENMGRMFDTCSSLTNLDVSNFDTSKVENMERMFDSCSSLTSLDVSNFDTSKVTSMYTMFTECTSLESLDLSSFDTSKVTDMGYMFSTATNLHSIQISNKFVVPTTNMFANTSNLTAIIITSKAPSGDQFANATAVLPSQVNFYVPNDSESAYETAFASYDANRVRPIFTATNTTVELMQGETYMDDTYVTIAEFDKSQKEYYEPYGYKVTASGDVKTDTPGTYTRTYTLTRTYSGDSGKTTDTVATKTRNVIVKAITITTLKGNTDILPPTGSLVVRDAVKENNVNLVESQVVVIEIHAQDNTCTGNGDIWYYLSVNPIQGNIPESDWKVYSEGITETITLEKVGLTYSVYMVLKDKYGNVSGTYINEKYTVMFDANGGKAAPLPQSVKFGTPLYLTYEKPYYDGKYFMGWSTVQGSSMEDYEGTILYRQGDVIPANTFTSQNTTLYAVWADRTSQLPRLADMVKVGDYVDYPVHYENVTAGTLKQGWKVLSIEEDGTVNLVSAGIPMTYKNGGNTETATRNLTTNFLETPFTLAEDNTFKKNGFNPYITLTENFTNEYTAIEEGKLKVRAMMKEDAADGADILATGEISIRPVVSLKPNVRTTGLDATRAWEIEL